MKFKILDLFCGAGGFSCGLDSLEDFETVIGVDFDKNVLETYKKNIKGSTVILGDLTDDKTKDAVVELAKEKGINMIIGGPPCQGFSSKGKNLGLDDPRNFLFKEYVNLVSRIQPEVFVIENVKNLLTACNGYFLKQINDSFHKLGYIINYGVLNAADFGVPEHRERAIIIGSRSKSIDLPAPADKKVTVRDAISDLAYLESGEGRDVSRYITEPLTEYQKEMRKGSYLLYNHKATSHSKVAIDKLKMIPVEGDKNSLPKELWGKQQFYTTWSRLVWDEQSPTIDTRFDTPSNGRNSHPFLNRAITPREAARIQSFPDTFIFYGKKTSICKQIGNAVPPLLAKAIGKKITESYKERNNITEHYKLYLANSVSFVKELISKNKTVDAIITDPPYNISKENNFNTLASPRKGIDFGYWDNNFNVCGWIKDYVKLLKPDGSIIIFCSYLYISYIIDELKKNGIDVKDVLIWKKSNPMPRNINRRYVQDMEFAIWGVKAKAKWTFNKPDDKPYLRSIFETPVVSGKEKTGHPTQKSLDLMEQIINIHTNENDWIIDPFMGSGTTGLAAIKNKRNFIGIEVNPEYYESALSRFSSLTKSINN
ncbi:MAG: DNA (cytosine-5-)-methyltransferase [Clostridia bacterium]|nr:DNA (cytosine-5-)-methyltransferase [Clostridia bacterium]